MGRKRSDNMQVSEWRQSLANRFAGHLRDDDTLSTIAWGQTYLPHYMRLSPSVMHHWIANNVDKKFPQTGSKAVVVGPRGGAKSTIGCLATALSRACKGQESFIGICSDTVGQAVGQLSDIKAELESNPKIEADYPEAFGIGPIWRNRMIEMRNGVRIAAFGTLSRIRGVKRQQHRPSLIILDDPENEGHTYSQTVRDRTWEWFTRTLLPIGDKRTNFVVLGTPLHPESLVMRLMKTPGWGCNRVEGRPSVFKSILQWPKRMDLWDKWETILFDVEREGSTKRARKFFEANKKAMLSGSLVLWPSHETLYELMIMRAEMGHRAFEGEKQGNPLASTHNEWPEDYLGGEDFWFDEWPKDSQVQVRTMALDPSKGKDARTGDYSAIPYVTVDHKGVYYVDLDMERRSTDKIVSDLVEGVRVFHPNQVGIETNQFQSLLAEDIANEATARDVDIDIVELDNRVNKNLRIRRLSPLLRMRKIRFKRNSRGAQLCVRQLRDFPNADHDDGPDALEMACRVAARILGQSEYASIHQDAEEEMAFR